MQSNVMKLPALMVAAGTMLWSSAAVARDWTLERVVERARSRAVDVVDARGALRSATAAGQGARLPVVGNPFIETVGETSRLTSGPMVATKLYVPVEINGQRAARIDEWERLTAFHSRGLTEARARATGEGVSAYAAATIADARVALARQGAADAAEEVQAIAARVRAGDATVHTLSLAEADAARWGHITAEAEVVRAHALARLGQIVGEPVGEGLPGPIVPALTRTWTTAEIGERARFAPKVRVLDAEAELWAASVERSSRERWSPLQLVATAGRGELGEARVGGGLAWSLPVLHRNQGSIARGEAERARALELGAALRGTTEVSLRGLVDAHGVAVRGVEAQDKEGIPAAERAVAHVTQAYRAGKAEFTSVLTARRDLAVARSRRLDLLASSWDAYATLASLSGELP